MWTMEDVLSELSEREGENEKARNGLPPGFRFHPTDEELITFYLASKVFYNHNVTTPVNIAEVDLNRCEPWDLPERAKMGEKEWYLYSLRDRKYPTGLRTNRATGSGYWKATGKDRQVHASSIGGATGTSGGGSSGSGMLIGMKKTLVFYQGRAPRGVKTRWVMHEYRLDGHFSSFRFSSKEEWVICRIFQKHGGEKKTTFHPTPSPLSPFLRCLPPLLDISSTSSSSTNQSLQNSFNNNNNKPHNNNNFPTNHHSNFLLQSLLTNPLPNFSSLTDHHDPTTLFPIDTVSAGSILFENSLSDRVCDPGKYKNNNVSRENKICHDRLLSSYCEMDDEFDDGDEEQDYDYDHDRDRDDVTVGFDMSSSVAALDRFINPHHVNFSAESWATIHP